MAFRIGQHFFMGRASTGYEGKGFLSYGTDVAKVVYLDNLRRRSIVAARLNVQARKRTIINKRGNFYEYRVESNLDEYLEKKRVQMLTAAISALEVAGKAGVDAAVARFNETLKGTATVNPETSGDTKDIPSNIGFSVQQFALSVWGVTIGPIEPSVKMWAQEYGLV